MRGFETARTDGWRRARRGAARVALVAVFFMLALLTACESGKLAVVDFYVEIDGKIEKIASVATEIGKPLENAPEVPKRRGYVGHWDSTDFSHPTKSMSVHAVYEPDGSGSGPNEFEISFFADGVEVKTVLRVDGPTQACYEPRAVGGRTEYASLTEKEKSETAHGGVRRYREGRDGTILALVEYADAIPDPPKKLGCVGRWDVSDFDAISEDAQVFAVYAPKQSFAYFRVPGKDDAYAIAQIRNGRIDAVPEPPARPGRIARWVVESADGTEREFANAGLKDDVEARMAEFVEVLASDADGRFTARLERPADSRIESMAELERAMRETGLAPDDAEVCGCYRDANMAEAIAFPLKLTRKTILFTKWMQVLATPGLEISNGEVTAYSGEDSDVRVPYRYPRGDGMPVTRIAPGAFRGRAHIETLRLPGALKEIGAEAFKDCARLEIVEFGDGCAVESIGEAAFEGCAEFSGLIAPNLREIGARAYAGCGKLREATFVAGKAEEAGDGIYAAFGKASGLDSGMSPSARETESLDEPGSTILVPAAIYSVRINAGSDGRGSILPGTGRALPCAKEITAGPGITAICDKAFETDPDAVDAEERLAVELPDTLESIGADAFAGRRDLAAIRLPGALKRLGDRAFFGLERLGTVEIAEPNELRQAGERAFDETPWFESGMKVVRLGRGAFGASNRHCGAEIRAEDFGDGCEFIAPKAFKGCVKLKRATLGAGIVDVGEEAFADCVALERFEFNAPAPSGRTVGKNALAGAVGLKELVAYDDIPASSMFESAPDGLETLWLCPGADGEKTARKECVKAFRGAKRVYFSDEYRAIEAEAFASDPSTGVGFARLTEVGLGTGIRIVGEAAFRDCSALTTLKATEKTALEEIGAEAFKNAGLKDEGAMTVLPAGLRKIGAEAFFGCRLAKLRFESDPVIGARAFANVPTLKTVEFADRGQTEREPGDEPEIGAEAFANCNIGAIALPKYATRLGQGILAGNRHFHSLESSAPLVARDLFFSPEGAGGPESESFIPDTFATAIVAGGRIAAGQYAGVASLRNVEMREGTTEIGASAFEGCAGLAAAKIPDGVTKIGKRAFADCAGLKAMRFPSSAIEVGNELFVGCAALERVEFNDEIEPNAEDEGWSGMFDGCVALEFANLPPNIRSIGRRAYAGCAKLARLRGAERGITRIGEEAFAGCAKLEFDGIALDELKTLGASAFMDCEALRGIRCANAEGIGKDAFEGCSSISEITVRDMAPAWYVGGSEEILARLEIVNVCDAPSEDAFEPSVMRGLKTAFVSAEGLSDEDADRVAAAIEKAADGVEIFASLAIWPKVSSLTERAICSAPTDPSFFEYEKTGDATAKITKILKKTKIVEGEKVVELPAIAYLPSSVMLDGTRFEVTEIGPNLVAHDASVRDGLKSIIAPASVERIGSNAFAGCAALEKARFETGGRLKAIGEGAFSGCVALKRLDLPGSLAEIGKNAFAGCGLETLETRETGALASIGEGAFENCASLERVVLGGPTRDLGENSFSGCSMLSEFAFGANCATRAIPAGMFSGCETLESIAAPDGAEEIRDNAFFGCLSLADAKLPSSAKRIGDSAFDGCVGLARVELGSGSKLEKIGARAFAGCSGLVAFGAPGADAIALPDGVAEVGQSAFCGCGSAQSLEIGRGTEEIGAKAFADMSALTRIRFDAERCADLAERAGAFAGAGEDGDGIKLTVGPNALSIPANLFRSDGEGDEPPRLTSAAFEETPRCEGIGAFAFAFAFRSGSATVPVSVARIGESAFAGCSGLKLRFECAAELVGFEKAPDGSGAWKIGLADSNISYGFGNGEAEGYRYAVHGGKAYLTQYVGNEAAVIVPESLNGLEVAGCGSAFDGCEAIRYAKLPDGISDIGSFSGCSNLVRIDLPRGIRRIPSRAFENCESLVEAIVPSTVTRIGARAFAGCSSLGTLYCDSAEIAYGLDDPSVSGGARDAAECVCVRKGLKTNERGAYSETLFELFGAPEAIEALTRSAERDGYGLRRAEGRFSGRNAYESDEPEAFAEFLSERGAKFAALDVLLRSEFVAVSDSDPDYSAYTRLQYLAGDGDAVYAYLARERDGAGYALTVTGVGAMRDYVASGARPWSGKANEIARATIERGVTRIGANALSDLPNLKEVAYRAETARCDRDRLLFDGSGSSDGLTLTIGNGVVRIPEYLFKGCAPLTEIRLEDPDADSSLEIVAESAFDGCVGLTRIDIFPGAKDICDRAFYGCAGVEEIVVPSSVERIGKEAFALTDRLTRVAFDAADLEPHKDVPDAFGPRSKSSPGADLALVVGPAATTVPDRLFAQNTRLRTLDFSSAASLRKIGVDAFKGCARIGSVAFPPSLTEISDGAFLGCSSLSDISGGANIGRIGRKAFESTSYAMSESNRDGGALYLLDRFLLSVDASVEGLYSISADTALVAGEAFKGCDKLRAVAVPTSVVRICDGAFDGCSRLSALFVSSESVAKGLTSADAEGGIASGAKSVYVFDSENMRPVGPFLSSEYRLMSGAFSFFNGHYRLYTKLRWQVGPESEAFLVDEVDATDPAAPQIRGAYSMRVVGSGAVDDLPSAESAPWREYAERIASAFVGFGIENVGARMLSGCSGLESFALSDTVTKIGAESFRGCVRLRQIEIGPNVTVVERGAFYGCVGLASIRFLAKCMTDLPQNNAVFSSAGSDSENGVSVSVGEAVEVVPAWLFASHAGLDASGAISTADPSSAPNVSRANFGARSSCVRIGHGAFAFLSGLKSVSTAHCDALKTIDDYAFFGCSSLEAADLPPNLDYVGRAAFAHCSSLAAIVVRSRALCAPIKGSDGQFADAPSLKGNRIFEGSGVLRAETVGGAEIVRSELKAVIEPEVESIPPYLFERSNVSSAEFNPDMSVSRYSSIGSGAFYGCAYLASITIPRRVETVGEGAFFGCSGLTEYVAPFIGGRAGEAEASRLTRFGYVFGGRKFAPDVAEPPPGMRLARQTNRIDSDSIADCSFYVPVALKTAHATRYANVYESTFMSCVDIQTVLIDSDPNIQTVKKIVLDEFNREVEALSLVNGELIGPSAFEGCESLRRAELSARMKRISSRAFDGCESLAEFSIPAGVVSVGRFAFRDCFYLERLRFDAISCADAASVEKTSVKIDDAFLNAGKDKGGIAVTIGAKARRVPAYLFSAESAKKSVFSAPDGGPSYPPRVKSVEFEQGSELEEIGELAFFCAGKTDSGSGFFVSAPALPSGISRIGERAFEGTAFYESALGAQGQTGLLRVGEYFIKAGSKHPFADGEYALRSGTTLIADSAFAGCETLSAFYICQSCVYIGDESFRGCANLAEASLDANGGRLRRIGARAFEGCSKLGTAIADESAETPEPIGLTVGKSVELIGVDAFNRCFGLTMVRIDSAPVAKAGPGKDSNGHDLPPAEANGRLIAYADTVYVAAAILEISPYLGDAKYWSRSTVDDMYAKYERKR